MLMLAPEKWVEQVLLSNVHFTSLLQVYPEHRLQFFSLLRAITNHCFNTLFTMSPEQLKLVINSTVWAFRHTERNIAETGMTAFKARYSDKLMLTGSLYPCTY